MPARQGDGQRVRLIAEKGARGRRAMGRPQQLAGRRGKSASFGLAPNRPATQYRTAALQRSIAQHSRTKHSAAQRSAPTNVAEQLVHRQLRGGLKVRCDKRAAGTQLAGGIHLAAPQLDHCMGEGGGARVVGGHPAQPNASELFQPSRPRPVPGATRGGLPSTMAMVTGPGATSVALTVQCTSSCADQSRSTVGGAI